MGIVKRIIIGILTVLFVAGITTPVMAINNQYDETFYSNNDILLYNPQDSSCGTTDNIGSSSGYLTSKGIPANTAAAIVATFTGKTPFDTSDFNGGSYGQIPLPYGPLRTQFENNLKTSNPDLYSKYYNINSDTSKASIGESNIFLNAELDVLYNWVNTTVVSSIANINDRMTQADTAFAAYSGGSTKAVHIFYQSDGKTLIYSDMNSNTVLGALSEIGGQQAQALAWIYLWTPDYKSISTDYVKKVLDSLGSSTTTASTSPSTCSIGAGGLTSDQAITLMQKYLDTHIDYMNGTNGKPQLPNIGTPWTNQCTTFSGWFKQMFFGPIYSSGDGYNVATNLAAAAPKMFTLISTDDLTDIGQLQPFSIWSSGSTTPGHTGVILGIGSDGSIIVGEGNTGDGTNGPYGSVYYKDPSRTRVGRVSAQTYTLPGGGYDPGSISVNVFKDLNDFKNHLGGYKLRNIAVPTDISDATAKIDNFLSN